MKKRILSFNDLVRKYYSYIRRRQNLILANKNHRRQAILAKHIERLHAKLASLKLTIQKGSLATGVVVGAIAISPNNANAQNFDTPLLNPFSLVRTGETLGSPTFYDLDDDGDFDVLHTDSDGNSFYYENTGTNSTPVFGAPQMNPFGIEALSYTWTDNKLVDLDDDGDADLMIAIRGDWYYQENTGSASAPAFAAGVTNPFNLTYVYDYPVSDFQDLDNDGDLDMIAGNEYGEFYYFENIGSASVPDFDVAVVNPFNLQTISTAYYAAPSFVDLDGDGDFDLMAGEGYGDFYYFENIGTASAPDFDPEVKNPFNLTSAGGNYGTPTFVDLDNDGDLDMMSSNVTGSFIYYKNTEINLGVSETSEFANLEMYPNPSNGLVNINFSEVNEAVQIEILSMDGKLVYTQDSFNENHITIDASSWSSGIYTVKLNSKSNTQTIQLVVE